MATASAADRGQKCAMNAKGIAASAKWWYYVAIVIVAMSTNSVEGVNNRLRERYNWRYLQFRFPDNRARQQAIQSGEYVPANNVPLGTEIWRDRFFITIPRWLTGIAATLTYFTFDNAATSGSSPSSPELIPYPDYETNHIRGINDSSYENKIVSVFRLKVDECDRLWFVDTGLIDIIGTYTQVIRPRLFIYNLRTDRLIRRYTFPTTDVSEGTIFGGNMVVDTSANSCEDAYAYIPDFGGYRLVVYSYRQNTSWRIKHPYFYFDPFATTFYVGGLTFLWTDGIFGCSLSERERNEGGFRTFYFTSISSNYQFAVSTRYLRDRNIATNTSILLNNYRVLGTRGNHMQSTSHMYDEQTGTLFYTLVNRNGIGCWNSRRYPTSYSAQTNEILATDDVTMIFPNDIILQRQDQNQQQRENILWLLSDRLPVSNIQGLSANEVNFRLFSAPVSQLVRGTLCDPNTRS